MNTPTQYAVRPTQLETRERETLEWLGARQARRRSRARAALKAVFGGRSAVPRPVR